MMEQKASGQIPTNPSSIDVNTLSNAQIQKIMREITSRGLSQEQAIVLAKEQGATQSQIDQALSRIQQQSLNPSDTVVSTKTTNQQYVGTQKSNYPTKKRVAISEKTKKIFGFQLFNSENLSFEPPINIPIPQNYILGIGDQISINVWGASQTKYQLSINKNGSIIIPDIGPIFLAGITFEKGQLLIKNRLMSIYSGMANQFPNTWAEVSLGEIRSIKINVIGEINTPGTYTLPATASAFNALYLSGGPNENGSFREIKLIRDGRTSKIIDIYDFLMNADPEANVQLREQDILFVPTYKARIEIDGEVKRKGLFEIKNTETVGDLLRFSGGFGDKAYSDAVTVLRNNNKEREVKTVVNSDFSKFTLQNGDFIKVDTILNRFSNRVTIEGAILHAGIYELTPGMMLSQLIDKADGLREDAFLTRGVITRRKEDNSLQNISFDVKEIISGNSDVVLLKEDRVQINSIFEMRELRTIEILGELLKPASYNFKENMTLGDLIFMAGGFKEGADLSVIELSRRLSYEKAAKVTDKMNEIFQFSISRDLKLSTSDAAFKLQPFDVVFVRRAPGYREQGNFVVSGEIAYAGIFAISDKNERISDAIKRAGGLIPGAFVSGATLTRTYKLSTAEIEKKKQLMRMDTTLKDSLFTQPKTYSVGIELDKIMANPGTTIDLLLRPGDIINIPQELQTVKVSGSVMNPLALTFQKKIKLHSYINMAGGYSDQALPSKTYVIYPNGNTATKKGFVFRNNPKLTPGAEIIVPRKPEKKREDNAMKWISIASAMSSLTIAIAMLVKL